METSRRATPLRMKSSSRSISNPTTSTFSHLSRSSRYTTTHKTCNTGQASSCAIFVARMMREVASDNAHIINVAGGKSSLGNSPSADDAAGQSIAARNARRMHGFTTDTGALQLRPDDVPTFNQTFDSLLSGIACVRVLQGLGILRGRRRTCFSSGVEMHTARQRRLD